MSDYASPSCDLCHERFAASTAKLVAHGGAPDDDTPTTSGAPEQAWVDDGLPRSLDCLHSFCTGCVQRLVDRALRPATSGGGGPGCTTTTTAVNGAQLQGQLGQTQGGSGDGAQEKERVRVTCPVCGTGTPIPHRGIGGFLIDFRVLSAVETAQPLCHYCKSKNRQTPGVIWCQQCGKLMCQDHKAFHDEIMEGHVTVPAGNTPRPDIRIKPRKPIFCEIHPQQELTFLCGCKKVICRDCAILSHRSCTQPMPAEDAVKNSLGEIGTLTKDIKIRLPEIDNGISTLDRTLSLVDENAKKTKKDIDAHINMLYEAVKNRHLDLNKEVEEISSQKVAMLVSQKEQISMVRTQMLQEAKVADTLEEWSPVEVLLAQTKIKSCAKTLLQFPLASMAPVVDPEISFFGNMRSSSAASAQRDQKPTAAASPNDSGKGEVQYLKGHTAQDCIKCDGVVSSGVCLEKCKLLGTENLFRIGVTSTISLIPHDNLGNPCSPVDPIVTVSPSSCNLDVKRKASDPGPASQETATSASSSAPLKSPASFLISVTPTESGLHRLSIRFGKNQSQQLEFRAHARASASHSKLTALCKEIHYPTSFFVNNAATSRSQHCAEISLVDADGGPYEHGDVTPTVSASVLTKDGERIALTTHLSPGKRPGSINIAVGITDPPTTRNFKAGKLEIQAELTDGHVTGSPLSITVWPLISVGRSTLVAQAGTSTKATATLQLLDYDGLPVLPEVLDASEVQVTATCTIANHPVNARVLPRANDGSSSYAIECGPFGWCGEATVGVQVVVACGMMEGGSTAPGFTLSARVEIPRDLSWMDTSDGCGGFRQSTYDKRVRYAVSKDNNWDKDRVYDCPPGYHWASTAEAVAIFKNNGNTSGVCVYGGQGGWSGYTWGGKERWLFRFSDSQQTNGYKHAGNYDECRVEFDARTTSFAGICCIADT
ncbi:hypothetical protein Pelo_8958 [Pelomyxa schiedti]|nr:hypothetical protein Pelo_8958 [Pelomyxa schiedti]